MKCRICGAKLKKDGDICKSCYEEYCKEEALEKDVNEIYKVHRKYIRTYQLTQYFDWIIVAICIIIAIIAREQFVIGILSIVLAVILFEVALFFAKRKATNTKCTFYEKKVVWQYKDRKKTLAYSDIKDVSYYQNFFQKIFKLGDIQFRPDSGSYLTNGFEIKNVPDFENTWEKVKEIILSKREK